MGIIRRLFILLLVAAVVVPMLQAQAGRGKGRLNGVVTDEDGNALVDAKVVLEAKDYKATPFETTTNKKGKWAVMGIGTGNWEVIIRAQGYVTTTRTVYVSQLDRNAEVEISVKKATAVDAPPDIALLEEGNKLFKEEQYDKALAAYQNFFEANPAAVQVLVNIGNCYRETGEFDKAFEAYDTLLGKLKEQTPDLTGNELAAKVHAAMGETFIRKGDFDKATESFKQSLAIAPKDEVLAYNVGEIYFSNARVDEAITYFALATEIKPDFAEAYMKLGYSYLNKQDYAKAVDCLKKYLELAPQADNAADVQNLIKSLEKK